MANIIRAMHTILGMKTLGTTSPWPFKKFQNDIEILDGAAKRRTSQEEIDALEEARLAIEYIVFPVGEPMDFFQDVLRLLKVK
ncbi:hypothetical protein SUGI_0750940 [Cryptomeria japonica]|nr:hypothetical protein SUGI_0750940 [Cryptomeria japonica]